MRPDTWALPIGIPGVPNMFKVSGILYRSAQPTQAGMRNLQDRFITTIINLRSALSPAASPARRILLTLLLLAWAGSAYPATYYVSTAGADNNAGTSTGAPWATIAKVNASSFSAGDSILFKKGETWREQLTVPSSGSAGSPITFGAYGSGAKPIISGADLITGWSAYTGATEDTGGIWHAGMETGNTSEWTTVSPTNSTITASGTAKSHGSYGLIYTATASSNYGQFSKTIGSYNSGSVYARMYFYIPSGSLNASKTVNQFLSITTSTGYIQAQIITDASSNMTLKCALNPYALISQNTAISYDTWHYVELRYKLDASTGGGQCWLDGNSTGSNFVTDTSGITITTLLAGPYASGAVVNGASIYFDDFKVDNTAIGAFPGVVANAYKANLVASPDTMWFDNTRGTVKASIAALSTNNDFFFDSSDNTIKVISTDNASGRVIEGANRSYGATTNAKDYLTFQNFTFNHTKDNGAGFYVNASKNVIVDSSDLSNNYYAGFLASGNHHGNMTVSNSTVSYNGGFGINSHYYGSVIDDGNNLYTLNTLHHNGYRSMEASPMEGNASNVEYSHNTIYNNNAAADNPVNLGHNHGIYLGSAGSTESGIDVHGNTVYNQGSGSGIKVLGSGNIYSNLVYNNYQAGITVGFNDTVTNTINIHNNISYGNHFGLWEYGNVAGALNLNIYNNVFYNNNHLGIDAWPDEVTILDTLTSLNFKNNIVGGNATGVYVGMHFATQDNAVINNNLYYADSIPFFYAGASKTWTQWKALGWDNAGLNADPLFVSTVTPDFRLQAASPAINAGVNVGLTLDYAGKLVKNPPSIGAFEFYGGSNRFLSFPSFPSFPTWR